MGLPMDRDTAGIREGGADGTFDFAGEDMGVPERQSGVGRNVEVDRLVHTDFAYPQFLDRAHTVDLPGDRRDLVGATG